MYINCKTHLKPKTSSLQKLMLNDDYIDFIDEYKYLGIWIDSQLSFTKHVRNIISNVSFRLGKLSRIRNCISKKTSLMVFKCMILPVLDYGDVFYSHAVHKHLIDKLQVLQNAAVRIICKLPKRTNTMQDEAELNLLPLMKRRLLHSTQLVAIYANTSSNLAETTARSMRMRGTTINRKH